MECNIDIDISSDIAWFKLIYYNIKANGEFPLISTSKIIKALSLDNAFIMELSILSMLSMQIYSIKRYPLL